MTSPGSSTRCSSTCPKHAKHIRTTGGKLSLKSLQFHTTRLLSMANLRRLPGVQDKLIRSVEGAVEERLVRVLEQPPSALDGKLKTLFDVLFDLNNPNHERQRGMSTFIQDIDALLEMANGDAAQFQIRHFCRTTTGKTCCTSTADCKEKFTVAVLNIMLSTDGIPCESRRTNPLPNMKKTLVRQAIHELGASAIYGPLPPPPADLAIDPEAAANAEYLAKLNAMRVRRAGEFLSEPQMCTNWRC